MAIATSHGVILVLLVALYITQRRGSKRSASLPPGPRGLPFLGVALSIDASKPWFTFFEWRKLFGDLVYTRMFNMNVLVINSAKIARDLVELRSNIYSDRPKYATAEPYGIADGTLLMPYGDTWRLHRRIYHQSMNAEAAKNYQPMQFAKARQLIVNLAEDPQGSSAHLYTYSTSIIMSIVYGYDTAPTNDPYVEYVERGIKVVAKAAEAKRAALLEMFPFLLRLPAWMPGSFKTEATEAKGYATGFRTILFKMGLERMTSAPDVPSMISDAVRRNERNGNLPEVTLAIRNTSAVAYGAASETTWASLEVFLLAMVLYPDIRRKAQKEIDAVVGNDRLPDFSDRPSLPYVEAVLQESLRWYPAVPLGLPHATTTEDVYNGTYIPKGVTVLVNIWGLTHDEEVFPAPFEFMPERFLNEDGMLRDCDGSFAFGFGRRICPGRYVANQSMWIAIALMLVAFDFMKVRDDDENEIDFVPQFTPGTTSLETLNLQKTQTISVPNCPTNVYKYNQGTGDA
ncbi:cytochrome P450 [Chiua virens]|nr:cytochrome P450 [Chiua virens]